jgi:4-hydroxy-2-oxoheptanedioate aldolase
VLGGERLAGIFVQTPSAVVPELLGGLAVDFVCIDQEHSAFGPETVQALVAGAALGSLPAVVRVAEGTAAHIGAALDAGAAGVLVPRVSSAAAARDAVRFARYPPHGARGLGPGRAAAYGRRVPEALAQAMRETFVAVQIETREAVDALEDILEVDGLDLVFVGPGDLAASLGLDGIRDAALVRIVEDVLKRAAAAGVAAGAFAPDVERAAAWRDLDVRLLVLGSDLGFLAESVERAWAALHAARA